MGSLNAYAATVCAIVIVQSLQVSSVRINAGEDAGCWKTPTVAGGSQSCSCRAESYGVLTDYNCGSNGYMQRSYRTCKPSGAGYKRCGTDYVQIGSTWGCGVGVNWKVWSACIGLGVLCEKNAFPLVPILIGKHAILVGRVTLRLVLVVVFENVRQIIVRHCGGMK